MAGKGFDSLPDAWDLRRLDDVSMIIDSLHKTPEYIETGYPMVRVTDVQGGFLDLSQALHVSEGVYEEFTRRYAPKRGDIVFSRVGTYGNASYVATDAPFCLGQNTALERTVVGSTQKTISLRNIGAIQIPLPPRKELEAIAHILGTLDDKIELNRRMNETLEAIARAIFQSWFVDFDPVRAKDEGRDTGLPKAIADLFPNCFEDSDVGEIPAGWGVGSLGDFAEHPRRGIHPNEIDASTPYIALEHMPRRCIALSEWSAADGLESSKFAFKQGEILFGKLRPYFHKVGVAPVNGVCSTDIIVVTPRKNGWYGFVLGHISSSAFVDYTNAGSTGTRMPRTSWGEMARYPVVIPPDLIAEAFSAQIRPAVDRIVASIHESRTLAALRDALLPKLLSGELRVKDADRFIETAL